MYFSMTEVNVQSYFAMGLSPLSSCCWRLLTSSKVKGRAHTSLSTGLTDWWEELDREMLPSASWEVKTHFSLLKMMVFMLISPYLVFFVIGMIPVVHSTHLQNKVSAIPNSISTDQLKHRLFTVRGFNYSFEPLICFFLLRQFITFWDWK